MNYTHLFTDIGSCIAPFNAFDTLARTTISGYLNDIIDAFESHDQQEPLEGAVSEIEGMKSTTDGWKQTLIGIIQRRLVDDSVITDYELSNNALTSVLSALITDMRANSALVMESVVTVGSVSANASNNGNGTILLSKVLDGYNGPASGVSPHTDYNGRDSQLAAPSDISVFTCVSDSQRDGATEGYESFSWTGTYNYGSPISYRTEGSGSGPGLSTVHASGLLSNMDFESFTSNAPDSWTIDNGTTGTHIFAESTEYYRGSKCLEFTGNGSQATIGISQAFTIGQLAPLRRYCCAFRYKVSSVPGTGTMTVQCKGTGYSASSSEKVSVAPGSLPTSWTLGYFFVNLPAVIPSDFKLAIEVTGILAASVSLYIDSLGFGPVVYHNGVGAAAVAGSSRFMRGDSLTATITNNQTGVIQDFFRRAFRVQLPASASPTIADSLAT